MLIGETANGNMVCWRSGKIERECASSLSGETYALLAGCGALEWVKQAYGEFTNGRHDYNLALYNLRSWNASAPASPFDAQPKGMVFLNLCWTTSESTLL